MSGESMQTEAPDHPKPIFKPISRPSTTKDRVSESIASYGAESLSDAQLISTLLNIQAQYRAESLLISAGSMQHLLHFGPAELRNLGLSVPEAARLAAIPELLRRITRIGSKRPLILSPIQATAYLRPRCTGWTEERFGMLALNAQGELLADREISRGTATATLVSPREFFREALRYGATLALAWHNHPSGDPTPSREDCTLTQRLRQAGESLGLPLTDHLIIGAERSHSFRAAEGWDGC
jgi:DNA repair protein RadC